jgi:hypothetical protein
MDKSEAIRKAHTDEDFVKSPKFDNSLARFVEENPEGVDDATIARLLMISEEEVRAIYAEAIQKLQKAMGVK